MATPELTLPSSDNYSPWVLVGVVGLAAVGVIAVLGGSLVEGARYVGERNCLVELCAPPDQPRLPDGAEKNTSNPLRSGTVVTTTSASTVSPTNSATVTATVK